jgi:hypothetical protein
MTLGAYLGPTRTSPKGQWGCPQAHAAFAHLPGTSQILRSQLKG